MSDPQLTSFGTLLANYWREQLFRWRDMGTMSRTEIIKALYKAPQ